MGGQTDIAYLFIKKKIMEGDYRPSQKLTENELSKIIGVSRNTVKNALLKLEQENLVTVEPNKGASIKSFTLEEVLNYFEIREVLEGLVVKTVAKVISDSELTQLQKVLEAMSVKLEHNRLDEYSHLNRQFHNNIYQLASNVQAVELINMIKTQLIRYHFRTILIPGRNQESMKEHQRIYEALEKHDELEAQAAVMNHVSNVRQTIKENYQLLI